MPEAVLGLEEVALADEDGGNGVPQPVQGDVAVPGAVGEVGEPVAGAARRQAGPMVEAAGEQPRPELLRVRPLRWSWC